jgi:hypothetical protein
MRPLALVLLLMICPVAFASDQPAVVPMVPATGEVAEAAADAPLAAMRRMSRSDRRLAKEVLRDAAEAAGMRRLEFCRAVQRGDEDAMDELKLSLASHDDALRFDPDQFSSFLDTMFSSFLDTILKFIEQLLAIFSMFADANQPGPWMVNVGFTMAA